MAVCQWHLGSLCKSIVQVFREIDFFGSVDIYVVLKWIFISDKGKRLHMNIPRIQSSLSQYISTQEMS